MSFNTYHQQTTRLLREERQDLLDPADIAEYINMARGQVAGEGECIRLDATIPTVVGQRGYSYSSINIGTATTTGVAGVIHVRRISYAVGNGRKFVRPKPWPWFDLYYLNQPVVTNGPPMYWSQFGQGATPTGSSGGGGTTFGGSFSLEPPPDQVYTLVCDCVCYPQPLQFNNDIDAIPYLWSDAVPFLAAWYALVALQSQAKGDPQAMMANYNLFVAKARQYANPSPNRVIYEQANDPVQMAKVMVGGGKASPHG